MSTGPTGIRGLSGDQGPIGLPGYTGPTGLQGVRGPQGSVGPSGLRGFAGPIGLDFVPIRGQTVWGNTMDNAATPGIFNRTLDQFSPLLASQSIPFFSQTTITDGNNNTIPCLDVPAGTYLVRAWASSSVAVGKTYILLSSVTSIESSDFIYTTLVPGTITFAGTSYIQDTVTLSTPTNVVLRQFITNSGIIPPTSAGGLPATRNASITFIKVK